MKVTPISSPLPGEHLAGVSPVMQPESNVGWRSRLNFWTGRSLTEQALNTEQENRAARLAWRGRSVTSGVVAGLEVALEPRHSDRVLKNPTLCGQFVHIMPGYGVMATGEDVYIPKPLRVDLDAVPVIYGQKSIVEIPADSPKSISPAGKSQKAPWFNNLDFGGKVMRFHVLNKRYVPWAAVLVVRPVSYLSIATRDPQAPCLLDPTHDAFDDPRIVDASQLVLFMLPPSWRNNYLPGKNTPMTLEEALTWRNRVASMVFDQEMKRVTRQQVLYNGDLNEGDRWMASLASDDLLSWEYFGVPIGLIGFEPDPANINKYRIFLDRYSVVRDGGRARPRPRPAPKCGTRPSWDRAGSHLPAAGPPGSPPPRCGRLALRPPAPPASPIPLWSRHPPPS